jgi:O-antigen/teichoic acid export membrane protein
LVVQALEQHGFAAAHEQLRKQLAMLLAIAVPAAAGLAICSENIAEVVLGEAFRASATMVIPWIALTALIAGIKAFYLDLSFQLGHHTQGQVRIMVISAFFNLVGNMLLIPVMGLKGALVGSAGAYMVGFMFSLIYGRRVFRLPAPTIDTLKIVLATILMIASLVPVVHYRGKVALTVQLLIGFSVYLCSCMLFDVMDIRKKAFDFLRHAKCFNRTVQ